MTRIMEIGDIVKHKASKQQMVVVVHFAGSSFVKCRYQNPVNGLYEVQEFKVEEVEGGKR